MKKSLLLFLPFLLLASPSAAQTTWTGLGDGVDWFNPGNWDNGLPDAADVTVISVPPSGSVEIGSSGALAGSLTLEGDVLGSAMGVNPGGDLTVTTDLALQGFFLDSYAGTQIDIGNDASFTSNGFGNASGVTAVGGALWTIGGTLSLGLNGGEAYFQVIGGSEVASQNTIIGAGGVGSMQVTGSGSALNVSTNLFVGDNGGDGTLTVESGGLLGLSSVLRVGWGGTGQVTVTGTGSSGSTVNLRVGIDGTNGYLDVLDGASFDAVNAVIGSINGGIGAVTVNDATLTGGQYFVGIQDGSGTLSIENGSYVNFSTGAIVGFEFGASGDMVIAGGSVVDMTTPFASELSIGFNGGDGSLLIDGGSTLTTTGDTQIAADFSDFQGRTRGTVTVSGAGTTWTNTGTLSLAANGAAHASLYVEDGAEVTVGDVIFYSGIQDGGLFVDGAGSSFESTSLSLDAGMTVSVTNGGELTSGYTVGYLSGIASDLNIVIDGAGSVWNATSDLDLADFYAGLGGIAANMTLSNGGTADIAGTLYMSGGSVRLNIGAGQGGPAAAPGVLDALMIVGQDSVGGLDQYITFNHTSNNYSFDVLVDGLLDVNVAAGTTILTAANTYTGDTTVSGGRLIVDGSIVSDTSVGASGLLGGTGIVGNVSNDGVIAPGAVTTPGTLTIAGNYVGGAGSELRLNTELGLDASPTDLLVIDGGAATGATQVFVTNAGGLGGYSTADGIRVIQAVNGATIQAGMFTLGAPAQIGIYNYDLVQGGDDVSEQYDFFLRAVNLAANVPVYAATPELVMGYMRETMGTVHDRMDLGEELKMQKLAQMRGFTDAGQSLADIAAMEGAWVRAFGGQREFKSGDAAGSGYESSFGGVQAGKDVYRRENDNGSRDHAGLYVAQGKTVADMTANTGNAGKASFDSTALGAYWTRFTAKDAYAGITAQYSRVHKFKVTPTGGAGIDPGGNNYAVSIEAGKQIKTKKQIMIEPQAQLLYQRLTLQDANDGINQISFKPLNSVTARGGIRASRAFETDGGLAVQPWTRLNVYHTLEQDSEITMGADTFKTPFGGTQGEIQLGLSLGRATKSGTGWSLYTNAGYIFALSDSPELSGWTASAGVRWNW